MGKEIKFQSYYGCVTKGQAEYVLGLLLKSHPKERGWEVVEKQVKRHVDGKWRAYVVFNYTEPTE